ncbi:MAG TPA: ATP-binding protein, partial [Lysobacter sp.]
ADRADFVAGIRAQSERLAQMIDKLLALAAVEHRQKLDDAVVIDVAALLQDVAGDCRETLRSRGQSLAVRVDDGLPPPRGDAFLLRQAVANLVENASDFSPPGAAIELYAERAGDALAIRVLDRGAGVPDYAAGRVFERFYSLPRPDGGSRSSGLGLCFVAEVADLHGGAAELLPREGGGTEARLVLPR